MNFLEKCKLKPDFLLGNSIGEYAALYCANVLTLEDAVMLVKYRAEYMDKEAEENYGVMYDVKKIEISEVEEIVKSLESEGTICMSNYNGKNNVVISGEEEIVNKAIEQIIRKDGRVIKLSVSSGFHSLLMKKAAQAFEIIINYNFSDPETTVFSNITGLPYDNAQQIKNTLSSQITSSVKFFQTISYMENENCTVLVEFGPKKVLKNLIQRNSEITVYSYDDVYDRAYAEMLFDKNKYNLRSFGQFLKEAVVHENCNEDISGYDKSVIKPYRIEKLYHMMRYENYIVTEENIIYCRELLFKILNYKKVKSAEMICEQIYDDVRRNFGLGR